jgi:hypothetical protein
LMQIGFGAYSHTLAPLSVDPRVQLKTDSLDLIGEGS